MPRNLSPALLAAFQAPIVNPVLFISIEFVSATVYFWSGFGSVVWNGQTWIGTGGFLGLSELPDSCVVSARGIQIRLSGFDPTFLPEVLGDFKVGLPVSVFLGAYSSGTLISSPISAWAGYTDSPQIEATGPTATITLNCENRLVSLNVPTNRRYTHEDQQSQWPNDLGFMFVDSIQEVTIYWGQQAATTTNL